MELLLWGILPYIVLTIFIGGHIYRYQKDQFGWTTKSSEFLEKKRLRVGSLLFHWGIIFVFGGHIFGLIIPIGLYNALGITEHMYHTVAIILGFPAGIAAFIGIVLLTYRRISIKRMKATTSPSDWVSLIFILLAIITGLIATSFNVDSHGFDYRTTIAPWLRGLFIFNIQPELMASVPIWFKIHIYCTFALYVVWPFTRLVHAFSFPIRYLSRNYVIYKRRVPRKATEESGF
ncbi:MAG: respiratory nitrate reductase subunit gamma [Bacillota bacterium]|uniref:Respiratory nitrate reductase subunit gamma n=1 Tax=Virgibacillus salarius TaxID=447199 RepID=A0A941DVD5_9BACI|nr:MULTISPECIES: respiratory nitrate reductase subunit gamma [Virgibacillus]NAZ10090.1 respiratory nitrate reductase subunit gamma [Agaribacter marinus]MBR7797380.1 respiratory nitrate reductase subunit gamma [Virgibacillus salarius]MCC2250699.1 respiratory nitrate reductase subunit gamma [Virgibacillus sp. AGTR]QRZ17191.1 respiratory nitrate reductase subunit gamma [Virgibacillus sp. AGTR]WBX79426.1 respiratory nitrate reductase subunit gamma [Virgibacillus salarius]